jgi:phosphoglycerate dehydrogenase-like enzyme
MRGIFSDVVAEHALGLLFSISRNLHIYARQQAQRSWSPVGGESERSDFITGPGLVSEIDRRHRTLQGATLGIIGCGGIGSALARKAASLEMQILALDRQALSLLDVPGEVWPPERLPELLRLSDYVCIAAPHTPETQHLIRRPQLRQMRPTAWLLNVGRGSIVALEDLTQALQAGELAGAALDVLEVEPLPADHPLWTLPNVILTPHVAAADVQVPQRHLQLLLENVRRFSTGQPLLNIVQKQLWH